MSRGRIAELGQLHRPEENAATTEVKPIRQGNSRVDPIRDGPPLLGILNHASFSHPGKVMRYPRGRQLRLFGNGGHLAGPRDKRTNDEHSRLLAQHLHDTGTFPGQTAELARRLGSCCVSFAHSFRHLLFPLEPGKCKL